MPRKKRKKKQQARRRNAPAQTARSSLAATPKEPTRVLAKQGSQPHANPPGVVTQQEVTVRSAPLPEPSELRGYEEVLPGAADRIVSMAEGFADHKQRCDTTALRGAVVERRLGQIFAFLAVLAVLLFSYLALLAGFETYATTVATTTLVSRLRGNSGAPAPGRRCRASSR